MNNFNKKILGFTAVAFTIACGSNPKEENPAETKEITPAFDVAQIDSTINPCDDFEKFAVGNWLKNNPVPESEGRWGSFNVLNESNEIKLKGIIEDATKAKAEKNTPLQQVGDFYTSALDSNTVNELGLTPLESLLTDIEKINSTQELVETMAKTRKYGSGSIFSGYVGIDSKNSTQYITYLSQGGIGLPDRDYYFPKDEKGKEILAAYEKHIAALFILSGEEQTLADENASKVVALETELASNSMTRVERRNPMATYNKMTMEELQNLCPSIDWKSYFTASEFDINKINDLVVSQPEYFKKLDNALKNTDLNTWKTYMKWHLINDFSSNLSIEFEQQHFSFYSTILRGVNVMKPRWKRALSKSNNYVGEQIGKLFVEQYFPEESKQKVMDLINNINAVFKERVQKLDWMGEETKVKALDKLSKFTYKIGYPDEWKDYSDIEIDSKSLIQNVMNATYFGYLENVNRLGKPIDKGEWGMTPQTINAYYNPRMNEIVFPAAILQPPFFNPDADDAINYGGIGGVIGHEFSHGFDDQGSKSDGDGNLSDWWTAEDRSNFNERTAKLVNQFNAYEVPDNNHVNGELTLGENIADISGITLAYYALVKSFEGKDEPAEIDGYNYKQRFFLGWAQVWHGNAKDDFLINQVKTDPHSPTRYRTIGPLTNMVEFQEAFGCEEGNMIAPDSLRVKIW
jgi:putative endopeptidase